MNIDLFHIAEAEITVKPCLSLLFSEDSEEKDVKTKKDDSHSAGNYIVCLQSKDQFVRVTGVGFDIGKKLFWLQKHALFCYAYLKVDAASTALTSCSDLG